MYSNDQLIRRIELQDWKPDYHLHPLGKQLIPHSIQHLEVVLSALTPLYFPAGESRARWLIQDLSALLELPADADGSLDAVPRSLAPLGAVKELVHPVSSGAVDGVGCDQRGPLKSLRRRRRRSWC